MSERERGQTGRQQSQTAELVAELRWIHWSELPIVVAHTPSHTHTHIHTRRYTYRTGTGTHLFYGQAAALGATLDEHLEMELRTAIA